MANAREAFIENENSFNVVMQKNRLEKNISYKGLAKAVGANKSSISYIEKGIHLPHVRLGLKICTVLDIDKEILIKCIYEEKMKRLVEDIESSCDEFEVEVPHFVKASSNEYVERMVTEAYMAGIEEGKQGAAILLKMNIDELLDI